ncbi:hypothetical protein, partial [Propionivibrio sp.]|uniref:hypothetical protein n=1 Tax=Propionivibrio sp. TaxID=2212460 RepID=UPI0025F1C485
YSKQPNKPGSTCGEIVCVADEMNEPRHPDVTQYPDAGDDSNEQAETFKTSYEASNSVEGVGYGAAK